MAAFASPCENLRDADGIGIHYTSGNTSAIVGAPLRRDGPIPDATVLEAFRSQRMPLAERLSGQRTGCLCAMDSRKMPLRFAPVRDRVPWLGLAGCRSGAKAVEPSAASPCPVVCQLPRRRRIGAARAGGAHTRISGTHRKDPSLYVSEIIYLYDIDTGCQPVSLSRVKGLRGHRASVRSPHGASRGKARADINLLTS